MRNRCTVGRNLFNCKLSPQVPLVWSNGASVSLNKVKGQKRFESDLTKKRRSRASMSTQLGRRRCSGAILSSLELHFLWSAPNPLMDGTLGFAQKCFLFVGSIHCCGFWTKIEIFRTFVFVQRLCNVCVFAMFPILLVSPNCNVADSKFVEDVIQQACKRDNSYRALFNLFSPCFWCEQMWADRLLERLFHWCWNLNDFHAELSLPFPFRKPKNRGEDCLCRKSLTESEFGLPF